MEFVSAKHSYSYKSKQGNMKTSLMILLLCLISCGTNKKNDDNIPVVIDEVFDNTVNNPLVETEWRINRLLCLDKSISDYEFGRIDTTERFLYGDFVKFPDSVNFVSYYSAPCGNDCFQTVYGKYRFSTDTTVVFSVDSVT
jgi:hypothetical protein